MVVAKKPVSYPCLSLSQNKHRFYLTSIPVSDLFSHCFVTSRDEDNLNGFQRQLSQARADDIAAYLNQGSGSIPTTIILSAQEDSGLKYNSRSKQVGVPAALLLDIKQLAQIESERDSILRDIFDAIKKSKKLSLSAQLSPAKSVTGKISRVTFNRAVGQALDSSILQGLDNKKRISLVTNYLEAFEKTMDDQKLLTRSAFLEAIFDVFEQAVRQSLLTYKNAKTDSIQKVIAPIAKYSYADSTLRSVGQLKLAVRSALAGSITIASDML